MSGLSIAMLVANGFVALTAIGGGIALISGLEANRFPLSYLEGTPFKSFVGPGIILAVAVGGSAAIAAVLTVLDAQAGAIASLIAGAILVGYISIEIAILNQPKWTTTEAFYIGVGLVVIVLAALELLTG